MSSFLSVVERLAKALDAEDYDTARPLLAVGCVYHLHDEILTGADAIIASYESHGESAKNRFDAIEYDSRVESTGDSSAVIEYIDRVRIGERWHEHRCRQHVHIDAEGQVAGIRHEDIPGERERLNEFEAAVRQTD